MWVADCGTDNRARKDRIAQGERAGRHSPCTSSPAAVDPGSASITVALEEFVEWNALEAFLLDGRCTENEFASHRILSRDHRTACTTLRTGSQRGDGMNKVAAAVAALNPGDGCPGGFMSDEQRTG